MTALQRFIAYATAFEQTYDDDDWRRIEPFFAPDAVYEVQGSALGCRLEGRAAIVAGLKKSLDGFDRRFAKRALDVVDGTHEQGDTVAIGWTATYAVPGASSLVLRGRSTATVRDGQITRLVDAYPDGMDEEVAGWLARHAPGASPSYV
jgi:ketosteroid isomerase-like protein